MIALLYWAAPNVRGRGFQWISPGSVLATLIWLAASAGFALYAANFGSYNKTYGTLAGAIVFLVWLWLTNLAILLGLEFDAELARERAIDRGRPTDGGAVRGTAGHQEVAGEAAGDAAVKVTGRQRNGRTGLPYVASRPTEPGVGWCGGQRPGVLGAEPPGTVTSTAGAGVTHPVGNLGAVDRRHRP